MTDPTFAMTDPPIGEGGLLPLPGGARSIPVPVLFARAGDAAVQRLIEFFTAEIRNANTRTSYARAVRRFDSWCVARDLALAQLTPFHVASYVEELGRELSKPSVKQHLAALRMLGDYLVIGQVIPSNPAAAVRGPKYVVKKGKTPVLSARETKELFASIETDTLIGRRDRALIGVMAYSFARISAVLGMNVGDFYQQGRTSWIRLHEKGGKEHEVPAHHTLVELLDAYLQEAGLDPDAERRAPLFRSFDRRKRLSGDRLERREALAMVKRRAVAAGLGDRICNHTFRATGITCYLQNQGTVEQAMRIAAHESPRTTQLYDRTDDALHLDEIEKIRF
jgi:integrase/recombinase XerD